MSETRKSAGAKIAAELGCVLWPVGIGLFFVWLAERFGRFNWLHLVAVIAFGIAILGLRVAVVDRLRKCPHGVRGAVSSPPLCAVCLAEKKAREHADRLERKRRVSEKADS